MTGPTTCPQSTHDCLGKTKVHFGKFAEHPETVFTRFDTNAKINSNWFTCNAKVVERGQRRKERERGIHLHNAENIVAARCELTHWDVWNQMLYFDHKDNNNPIPEINIDYCLQKLKKYKFTKENTLRQEIISMYITSNGGHNWGEKKKHCTCAHVYTTCFFFFFCTFTQGRKASGESWGVLHLWGTICLVKSNASAKSTACKWLTNFKHKWQKTKDLCLPDRKCVTFLRCSLSARILTTSVGESGSLFEEIFRM